MAEVLPRWSLNNPDPNEMKIDNAVAAPAQASAQPQPVAAPAQPASAGWFTSLYENKMIVCGVFIVIIMLAILAWFVFGKETPPANVCAPPQYPIIQPSPHAAQTPQSQQVQSAPSKEEIKRQLALSRQAEQQAIEQTQKLTQQVQQIAQPQPQPDIMSDAVATSNAETSTEAESTVQVEDITGTDDVVINDTESTMAEESL